MAKDILILYRIRPIIVSILSIAGTMAFIGEARAQGDPCRNIIPEGGAYRTIDLTQKNDLDILDYTLVKKTSSRSASLDAAGNAKFPVEGVPVDFGGTFRGAKSKVDAVQSARYFELRRKDFFEYRLTEGDPTIVNAWSKCLLDRRGLEVSFHPLGDDQLRYKLSIKWTPTQNDQGATIRLTRPIDLSGFGRVLSNSCERQPANGFFGSLGYWLGRAREADRIGPGGCDIVFKRRSMKEIITATVATEAQTVTIALPAFRNFVFQHKPFYSLPGIDKRSLTKSETLPAFGTVTSNRETPGYKDGFAPWRIEMPVSLRDAGWVFEQGTERITPQKKTIRMGSCFNQSVVVEAGLVVVANGASVVKGNEEIPCDFILDIDAVRLADLSGSAAAGPDAEAILEPLKAPSFFPVVVVGLLLLAAVGLAVWYWRRSRPSARALSQR